MVLRGWAFVASFALLARGAQVLVVTSA